MKNKGPKIGKAILKNNMEGLILPDNKTYYIDVIVKTTGKDGYCGWKYEELSKIYVN